jgi:hypothetical protein
MTQPRYFHGMVSRYSAGTLSLVPAERQAAASLLQRSGVSPRSIEQFLAGQAVDDAWNRHRLAGLLSALLDLKQAPPGGPAAPLLPAVQSAREAARRARKLQQLGVSALGAQQFFAGLAPPGAADRQILALILIAALRGILPRHGGGHNEMSLEDTSGSQR